MSVKSTYAYKARDATGAVVAGNVIAGSPDEVSSRLRAEGKYVLSIDDNPLRAAQEFDRDQIHRTEAAKRVRREYVIAFCQQLSVMVDTGVPLTEALDAFCKQMPQKEFKQVLMSIRDDINSGEPLSVAMARWPRVFPIMMISLMQASEASGTMALMLGRVGDYLADERRTARQIRGALTYPLFMVGCGLVMTAFLMAFVLPRFATIYEQRAATLPVPTKVLLGISDFLVTQAIWYGPAIGVLALGGYVFSKRSAGRCVFDWLRLHTPILGSMFRQLYITRAARTMATLVGSGVNLLDVIGICRGVTNNVHYDKMWTAMEDGIRNGKQLSDAFIESSYIPPSVASMISAGERSGKLSEVLERIAVFTEEELDASVKQVASYIEPAMIVFMGVIIGSVATALLLPIFSMGRVIAG